MDNMFFDSNVMASYLRDIRPSASLFSLIKFKLGGHSLRVETDCGIVRLRFKNEPQGEQGYLAVRCSSCL